MMVGTALALWRAELRVQRLISSRPAVAAVQLTVAGGILVLLGIRVRAVVAADAVSLTNVALLSLVGIVLIFANVVVTGQEAVAGVSEIRNWARALPISARQLRRLLIVTGLLRGSLFTATLIGTVAAGAITVATSWLGRAEIVAAALLLPLLPVAAGLWSGARRSGPVPPGLVVAPIGLAVLSIAVPLPLLPGVGAAIVAFLASPGLTLVGSASAMQAVAVLGLWAAGTLWLLSRLDHSLQEGSVTGRPPLASLLGRPRVAGALLDLAIHRLRPRDLVECGLLSTMVAVTALGLVADGSPDPAAAASFGVSVLAASAVSVGYQQVRVTTALSSGAESLVRTWPIRSGALTWVRHLLSTVGAGGSALVFTVIVAAVAGPSVGTATVVAAALAPLSLTGWLGVCRQMQGVARILAYIGFAALVGVRAVVVAVIVLLGCSPAVATGLVVLDVTTGFVGHLVLRETMRREP